MVYGELQGERLILNWFLRSFTKSIQPGKPRTAAETLGILQEQIRAATQGVKDRVEDKQRKSGIKDSTAEYWIKQLLEKAARMKADDKDRTAESITDELMAWLNAQPGDKVNPLLEWAGSYPFTLRRKSTDLQCLQASIRIAIHPLRYCIRSYWVW